MYIGLYKLKAVKIYFHFNGRPLHELRRSACGCPHNIGVAILLLLGVRSTISAAPGLCVLLQLLRFDVLQLLCFVQQSGPLPIRNPRPAKQLCALAGNVFVVGGGRARHLCGNGRFDFLALGLGYPVAEPVEGFRYPIPYVAPLRVNLDRAFSKPGQVGDVPLFGLSLDALILDQDGGPMDIGFAPRAKRGVVAPAILPTDIHGRSV